MAVGRLGIAVADFRRAADEKHGQGSGIPALSPQKCCLSRDVVSDLRHVQFRDDNIVTFADRVYRLEKL
jgi:hypothetical protein